MPNKALHGNVSGVLCTVMGKGRKQDLTRGTASIANNAMLFAAFTGGGSANSSGSIQGGKLPAMHGRPIEANPATGQVCAKSEQSFGLYTMPASVRWYGRMGKVSMQSLIRRMASLANGILPFAICELPISPCTNQTGKCSSFGGQTFKG